jgi:hypothetical protein
MGSTDTVNLKLRLPEALKRQLVSEAEKANRSLNSEILFRLSRTFGPEWQQLVLKVEDREKQEQEMLERISQHPKVQATLARVIAELREKAEGRKKKDR